MRFLPIFILIVILLASRPAVESYLAEFPSLRHRENWNQIITLGEKTLRDTLDPAERMKIHSQIAIAYFYSGEYGPAEQNANLSYELACSLQDQDAQVRALYILSATARALQDFDKAKEIALQALPMSQGEMRGKTLYNIGAAEADNPQGNFAAAEETYWQALPLFICPREKQRTLIRLARALLLQGKVEEAGELIDRVLLEVESERNIMLAEYIKAQIEKARGKQGEARTLAVSALQKALKLGAKRDAERIEEFLRQI